MATEAVTIHVNGTVQGVGFRAATQMLAMRLGISGDVQNLADGSVLVHAVGSAYEMSRFRQEIKRGPNRFARVATYEEKSLPNPPAYNGFNVVY